MRPIFCGNFEFEARPSDLERLFRRYGKVERVDMKSGYAFIYMEDERDAGYAIRALDRTEFGRKGRRLRVEWTKHERGGRKEVSSRKSANMRPSKTLFVINFPPHTKIRDLERHFDPYGKILNVRIRRNFAFVQYESQADATEALDATNMSKFLDRVISVEYSSRDDDDRRNGDNLDRRGRDRSPDRRRRSPSPYKRERGSPDYGTGSSPAAYGRERGSPVYGHGSSPAAYGRERGSPLYGRGSSPSPRRGDRSSPEYGQVESPNGHRRERVSPGYLERSRSPLGDVRRRERVSPDYRDRSQSPLGDVRHRERVSSDYGDRSQSPVGVERNGNGYGHHASARPHRKDEASPEDAREARNSSDVPEMREAGELEESPMDDRYRSQTPPPCE